VTFNLLDRECVDDEAQDMPTNDSPRRVRSAGLLDGGIVFQFQPQPAHRHAKVFNILDVGNFGYVTEARDSDQLKHQSDCTCAGSAFFVLARMPRDVKEPPVNAIACSNIRPASRSGTG
jgi:hypothetical protein